jgi:hypothetical protein
LVFSFLLILDEGGSRGGRVKLAYSSLAATACLRLQPRKKVRQKSGTAVKKCGEGAVNRRGIGGEFLAVKTAAPL